MKKILCLALFLAGIFCSSVSALGINEIKNKGFVSISTNADFVPFEYREDSEIVGIDIDISKKIAESLGVNLKINDVSFDAVVLELSNKNCDFAVAAMSASEEKSKSVDFSVPYYTAKQEIVVLNSSSIKSGSDLANKKIGVQFGFSGELYCSENFANASITKYNKIADAAFDLKSGAIDAVVVDDLPARKLVSIVGSSAKILDEPLFEESYRIAVPKGDTELLDYINSVLNSMIENGEINEIIESYVSAYKTESNSLIGQIYNNLINKDRYKLILSGLATTLKITIVALFIGIILGVCVALIKVSQKETVFAKILKFIANSYVLVIRGTPVVVQLFVICYIIFAWAGLPKMIIAMITFGINSGAYVSEIIRSGILSIDEGQYEAGRCLGLSHETTMRKIILPQAFRNVLPTLFSEFIQLIKETSVAGFVGIMDLSRAGDTIRNYTYQPIVPLLSVAAIYFVLVSFLTFLLSVFERRMKLSDRG